MHALPPEKLGVVMATSTKAAASRTPVPAAIPACRTTAQGALMQDPNKARDGRADMATAEPGNRVQLSHMAALNYLSYIHAR